MPVDDTVGAKCIAGLTMFTTVHWGQPGAAIGQFPSRGWVLDPRFNYRERMEEAPATGKPSTVDNGVVDARHK